MSPSPTPLHVVIVGGGFSGTAVALHLLEALPAGTRLSLVERAPPVGRGLAYATHSPSHWLNVPAGRLGWHPDDEGGFLAWLRAQDSGASAGAFVPRARMGEYLGDEWAQAVRRGHRRGVVWRLLEDEAVDLDPMPRARHRLHLASGAVLEADAVVLATGHAPAPPPPLRGAVWGEPGTIDQPWGPQALDGVPEDGAVLVLGTGLTAVDVVTALQDRGHAGALHLLSRRGLLPQPHRTLEARPRLGLSPVAELGDECRLRPILRAVRRWVREAAAEGRDWRDVMASLRPCTPALWQRLSEADRARFLRHLAPWWDSHRHRMAPGIHRRIESARQAGALQVHAGRLQATERLPDGRWRVHWTPRGATALAVLDVAAVVNCTGVTTSLRHANSALLRGLAARGLLQADPLGLGLLTDARLRPLDGRSQPRPGLFCVGPVLKARHWEAVAIPELRVHAREAAAQVMAALAAQRGA